MGGRVLLRDVEGDTQPCPGPFPSAAADFRHVDRTDGCGNRAARRSRGIHVDGRHPQPAAVCSHHGPGGTRPFMVLDKLSETGSNMIDALAYPLPEAQPLVPQLPAHQYPDRPATHPGVPNRKHTLATPLPGP